MRKLVSILLSFFVFLSGSTQTLNPQDSAWIKDNYTKKELYIPMRDGTKLFTAVYTPKNNSEAHPILMNRTPYSCAPYGETSFRAFWDNHWRYYMRRNYIIVLQDVRGRWMSEGEFVDVRPYNPTKKGTEFDEASDTYDAIDWLVKNLPNNNKKVGIFGGSYGGFMTLMAIGRTPDEFAAAVQWFGIINWRTMYRDQDELLKAYQRSLLGTPEKDGAAMLMGA